MRAVLFSTLLAGLPLMAVAEPIDDAIAARQGYFKLLGAEMGALVPMVKGEVDYSPEAAQLHADNLAALVRYNTGHLWAMDSSKADKPGKTRAEAVIWQDMDGFKGKGMALAEAVAMLQDTAADGQGALGKGVAGVGGTCKGCHDDYRAKDF
ncbi:c-type cytochrome [Actibacterium sp. D379-3]